MLRIHTYIAIASTKMYPNYMKPNYKNSPVVQELASGGVDLDVAAVLFSGQGSLPAWKRLDQMAGDVRARQGEKNGEEQDETANSHG